MTQLAPRSTLFPYTTLFRSGSAALHTRFTSRSNSALGSPLRYVACLDRKSTRLNSSHQIISYAVFCLKKKKAEREMSGSEEKQPLQAEDRLAVVLLAGIGYD